MTESQDPIQVIRSIPGTTVEEDGDTYLVTRMMEKDGIITSIETRFEKPKQDNKMFVYYMMLRIKEKELIFELVMKGETNFEFRVGQNDTSTAFGIGSEGGEPYYFQGFDDIVRILTNMNNFIKDKVVEHLMFYQYFMVNQLKMQFDKRVAPIIKDRIPDILSRL
jgi:hypothetical protein